MMNLATYGLSLVLSLFQPFSLNGVDPGQKPGQDPDQYRPDPGMVWSCAQFNWDKPLTYKGSLLYGTISATCTLTGQNGGGMANLRDFYIAEVPKNVKEVHQGPMEKVYKDLPSTYYDVTVEQGSGGDVVRAREDIWIATDTKTVLYFDTFSKGMNNSGNAQYVKKMDLLSMLTPGVEGDNPDHLYGIKLTAYLEADKPWFAPSGMFKDKVRAAVEDNIHAAEKGVIETIIPNI